MNERSYTIGYKIAAGVLGAVGLVGMAAVGFATSSPVVDGVNTPSATNLGGPLHASCHTTWTFEDTSCADVATAILKSGASMGVEDGWEDACEAEFCGYELSGSATQIKGTHTTPKKHYVDDLTFDLTTNGNGCIVKGFSTSEIWYAVLDSSTNYCNMYNLASKTGLTYTEETSDSICTQYSSRNCDTY